MAEVQEKKNQSMPTHFKYLLNTMSANISLVRTSPMTERKSRDKEVGILCSLRGQNKSRDQVQTPFGGKEHSHGDGWLEGIFAKKKI